MKLNVRFYIYVLTFLLISDISVAQKNNNERLRYRYKNDAGVQVIGNTIPAHYAQNGYEVLNNSNRVIRVVSPAPNKDDLDKAKRQREAMAKYEVLKRRYSTIDDIERAKRRKLQNINTNIAILKGSISNVENAIESLISQAAEHERAGRTVPESLLNQLSDTRSELAVSEDILAYREQEYSDAAEKYDNDIRAFIHGETVVKSQLEEANK